MRKTAKISYQDSRCPSQYSNSTPPEYNYRAVLLSQPARYRNVGVYLIIIPSAI
jgi:hypothetical protein